MTKRIVLKRMNQGTALVTDTLALPPLVIEGLEEFKGSFDRLCLRAGTAAIEAMLGADAEQLCGQRYQRHADRQGHRWGMASSEVGWHGGQAAIRRPRVRRQGGASWSFPAGRRSRKRTFCRAGRLTRCSSVWRHASTHGRYGCRTAIWPAKPSVPRPSPRSHGGLWR